MALHRSTPILYGTVDDVADSIDSPSAGYSPGSSAYSPSLAPTLPEQPGSLMVHQMDSPQEGDSDAPFVAVAPPPPSPNVGGMPGRADPLGYSIGLLPSRTFRQRFGGAVLVRPTMGVHPSTGPVGVSNRQGRLQANVSALVDQWLPSSQQVADEFTQPQAVSNGAV